MTDLVDLDWAEQKASEMRRDLNLTVYESFDPYELARVMEVTVVYDDWLEGISPQLYGAIFMHKDRAWSGATLMFPDGEQMVLLNHRHAPTRSNATLAEELAHIHIGHPASMLINCIDGTATFNYNRVHEAEAYYVGAAALATREQLQIAQGTSLGDWMVCRPG